MVEKLPSVKYPKTDEWPGNPEFGLRPVPQSLQQQRGLVSCSVFVIG